MRRWASLVLFSVVASGCSSTTIPATLTPQPATLLPVATTTVPPPPTATPPAATPLIEHPTGATEVVLRMYRSGGFLYPGTTLDEPPTFTLYGDGRVIYTVEVPLASGHIRRELHQARLTEEQIAALLENALGPGGLAAARDRYADVPVADSTTTNFEINAGGIRKNVAVYALGEFDEPGPDVAARAAFGTLAEALRGFGTEVDAGNAASLGPFEPEAYRVTLFPLHDAEFPPSAEWPWAGLEPADFDVDNSGFLRRVVTADQGELVAGLPAGQIGDPIVVGPDGMSYLVRARALLPDEVPAPQATPSPTGTTSAANEVVLRLTVYEFPSPRTMIEPPEFTLYSDGRVIYARKIRAPDAFWPSFELHSAELSHEQMTALVADALGSGGLRDARAEYDIPGGAFGMELEWNHFEVNAEGVDKEVRVYGLDHESAPDTAERAKFAGLASRLLDFEAEVDAGRAAYLGRFEPTGYDAFLDPAPSDLPVSADWPWADLDVTDFQWTGQQWSRITPEQAESVIELDINEHLIAEASDEEKYVIRIRPLLPDEVLGPIPAASR